MTQATLFTEETAAEAKFREFHADNPQVYAKLVELTREAKSAGRTKIGIGMLFEVLRWHSYISTTDPDYKMNNNYRSRYARLIQQNEPDLAGMFDMRELHS